MAKENKKAVSEERVELLIPRGNEREDPNLQIAVNGKTWLLPRGKKSLVPSAVAEEYERSQRADDAWHETKHSIKDNSKFLPEKE